MTAFRQLDSLDVRGKRVIVRGDLNVPVHDGQVRDATRIERLVPTLRELADKGAGIIILSHFGRPEGKPDATMSLSGIAPVLGTISGLPVTFQPTDWRAPVPRPRPAPGTCVLMENTRFHPGEETNDPGFAAMLATLGDVFVNDAFSTAHRAHASTQAIARLLPSVAGRAMAEELKHLDKALAKPARPLAAVAGGAKISSKLDLLANLVNLSDILILGGGMANVFLAAGGVNVGKSLCEHGMIETAADILRTAGNAGCEILLPVDAVVAHTLAPGVLHRTTALSDITRDDMILDIGPRTVAAINDRLDSARTLIWNGPLGAFETKPFDSGTVAAARHAADLAASGRLVAIAGGGDTVAALNHAGAADRFSYVSSAGGAFLEWLEGKILPGIEVLQQCEDAL